MKKIILILLIITASVTILHSESLLSTGAELPDFSFKDTQSADYQLSRMQKKLTLIHLWTARDRKSVASLAVIEKIYRKYRNEEITFISSVVDGYSEKVIEFVKKIPGFGYTLPVYIMALADATRHFKLTRLPQIFVVNQENKILYSGPPERFDPEKYLRMGTAPVETSVPDSGWVTSGSRQPITVTPGSNTIPTGTALSESQSEREALSRAFNPTGIAPTNTHPSSIFPEVQPETYSPSPSSLPVAQPWETDSGRGTGQIGIPLNIPGPGAIQLRYPTDGHIASGFGYRRNPFNGRSDFHPGIDIFKAGNYGAPVYASQNGVVVMSVASGNYYGYGLYIEINHGNSFSTTYGHLSAVLVANGQEVKKGQLIGRVGSTGASTGPHLHFELRYSGKHINPVPYFEPL